MIMLEGSVVCIKVLLIVKGLSQRYTHHRIHHPPPPPSLPPSSIAVLILNPIIILVLTAAISLSTTIVSHKSQHSFTTLPIPSPSHNSQLSLSLLIPQSLPIVTPPSPSLSWRHMALGARHGRPPDRWTDTDTPSDRHRHSSLSLIH